MNNKLKETLSYTKYRIKKDSLEVIWAINKYRNKRNDRHTNIWVYFILLIVLFIASALIFPMFAGFVDYVFNFDNEIEETIQASELTTIIIIATAIGSLLLWFTKNTSSKENNNISKNVIESCGKMFLVSALSLSLFMLLEPLLPTVRDAVGCYDVFIKYSIFLSLMIGSMTFIMAVLYSLIFIWTI
jgi:hypothetical protein